MIDQRSPDGAGWAKFSDDGKHRYLVGRLVSTRALEPHQLSIPDDLVRAITKVVFVMLNPSDANAWKPDPTWGKCCAIGRNHGADIVEAANLHSFVSPHPSDLWKLPVGQRGDDAINDRAILEACGGFLTADERSRITVVCAWGSHGFRNDRGDIVRKMLVANDIQLHKLDMPLTEKNQPMHPLARGKNHIPADVKVVRWPSAELAA